MAYEGKINETKYVIETDSIDPVSDFNLWIWNRRLLSLRRSRV